MLRLGTARQPLHHTPQVGLPPDLGDAASQSDGRPDTKVQVNAPAPNQTTPQAGLPPDLGVRIEGSRRIQIVVLTWIDGSCDRACAALPEAESQYLRSRRMTRGWWILRQSLCCAPRSGVAVHKLAQDDAGLGNALREAESQYLRSRRMTDRHGLKNYGAGGGDRGHRHRPKCAVAK